METELILELQKLMEEYREEMKEFREEVKEFREQWKSQADSTGDGTDEDEDLTVLDDGAEEAYYHVDVPHSSALEHSDNGDPDYYFICDDSDVPAGSEFSEDENGSNAEIDETDVVVLIEALESAEHKNRKVPVSALELFDESSKKEELKVEKLDIGLDIDEVVFAIGPWIKLVCLELHNSEASTVREVNDVHDSFDAMKLQETFLRGIYAYGLEKPSVVKMFDPSHDWGGVDQAASELIKTDVEPILEQYRPMISSMKFYKLTLGTVAMMEMEMQWDGTRVSVALPVQVNNIGDRPQICNLYVFDLNDLMWSVVSVTGDIPPPRVGVTMASIGDIYVVGGKDSTYKELNELYSFNTCTSKWTLLSSGVTGPAHRSYHSITSDVHSINFDDRNVYIFGGCGNNGLAVAQGIG